MDVQLPDWWSYPERCENGHEWGPGRVLVSFTRCDCPLVRAAYGETGGLGHLEVACGEPGCRSVWSTRRTGQRRTVRGSGRHHGSRGAESGNLY